MPKNSSLNRIKMLLDNLMDAVSNQNTPKITHRAVTKYTSDIITIQRQKRSFFKKNQDVLIVRVRIYYLKLIKENIIIRYKGRLQ